MADKKKKIEELTDEELNEAAGGFVITPKQLGFVECAAEGCTNKFKPINGERFCEKCRQKTPGKIF